MKLNDEQMRFAEEHHGIVYSFLNNNGLSDEEWYDIVVFGFLRAVVNYDKEKGAFSSFAYLGMRDAQLTELRNRNRLKRQGTCINIDEALVSHPYLNYDSVEDEAILSVDLRQAVRELPPKAKEIIEFSLYGLKVPQIVQRTGASTVWVYITRRNFRKQFSQRGRLP